MSILTEVGTKVTYEAKMKGLSVGYNKVAKAGEKHFKAFCQAECEGKTIKQTFNYIKKLPKTKQEATLYHVLQTWINKLTETHDPKSIQNYFGIIKKIARHEGIKISNEDAKSNLTFPTKLKERKYVLTLDDIHLILKDSNWNKKGFYLFLLSTGMRPKEALSIRKRHVTLLDNGMYVVTIPAQATKLKIERESFVSREVYPYLAKILRRKNDDNLIWTGQENSDYAVNTADATFRNLCNRIGLIQKYEHVNRRKLNLYCFRGFFYAKASRKHGDEYAHKMIGHEGYLPQYDRKTIDERMEMYREFENELITDQTQKQKAEIEKLKLDTGRLEKMEKMSNKINEFYDKFGFLFGDNRKDIAENLIEYQGYISNIKNKKYTGKFSD